MNGPTAAPGFDLPLYLKQRREMIDRTLDRMLRETGSENRIVQAVTYSLLGSGKRIRPILCLAAAEAVGKTDPQLTKAACALEMIHTYSLIHDDLPAMDNDLTRRGQPTCHVAFDEATAILAGDALLTLAFEILADAGLSDGKRHVQWFTVLHRVSQAAGCQGMIEGQIRDIQAEGNDLSIRDLETLHRLKTGALIEASVFTGAVLGGGGFSEVDRLSDFARGLGLAFQVTDDILNVEGDPAVIGKGVGTDKALCKSTYPSLLGLAESKALAKKLIDDALKALDIFDNKSDPLRAIASYIVNRNR